MKKLIAILICTFPLIISIIGAVVFFRPLPIIFSENDEVVFVYYEWENISDKIVLEHVTDVLKNHFVRRTFNNPFPSLVENELWGIRLQRNTEHVWISIGVDNILYRSASDRILYRIIDAEQLMKELDSILQSTLD